MRKFLFYALILTFFILPKETSASSLGYKYQTKQQVSMNEVNLQVHTVSELPNSISLKNNSLEVTLDAKIAFISTTQDDSIYAYNLNTGEVLSQIKAGKNISNLSLFDNGSKKLLAIINLNDPIKNYPVTISLLDVSNPKKMKMLSAFILPPGLSLFPTLKAVFDPIGEHLLIASKDPAKIFVFDVKNGQMIDQASLSSGANSINIVTRDNTLLVTTTSITEGKITVFELDSSFKLNQKCTFLLPSNFGFIANNNICFNKTATIAYVAAAKGNKLFSFNMDNGLLIDQYEVGDVPAQIALASFTSKNRIAVVNTGKNHGFLANSVSIIESDNHGYFVGATVFLPTIGINLASDSTIKFNSKGNIGFVGSRNQSLLAFDVRTGEQLAETKLLGSASRFVLSQDKLVAITNDNELKRLVVLDINFAKMQESKPQSSQAESLQVSTNLQKTSKEVLKSSNELSTSKITQVRACRVNHMIKIRVYGKGFNSNCQIMVNKQLIATSYIKESRLSGRFAAKLLAGKKDFSVTVKNLDGTSSLLFKKHLKCHR